MLRKSIVFLVRVRIVEQKGMRGHRDPVELLFGSRRQSEVDDTTRD